MTSDYGNESSCSIKGGELGELESSSRLPLLEVPFVITALSAVSIRQLSSTFRGNESLPVPGYAS